MFLIKHKFPSLTGTFVRVGLQTVNMYVFAFGKNRSVCVFFVHCCFSSCFPHHSLYPPSWLWFYLNTRVHMRLRCQPAVVSAALWEHCDSSVRPQLSFRPQPKLTAEPGSWGCCQTESWVSSGILIQPAVLEPESVQCENLHLVWQRTKPDRTCGGCLCVCVGGGNQGNQGWCLPCSHQHFKTITIICNLYKFQKWIYIWFTDVKQC